MTENIDAVMGYKLNRSDALIRRVVGRIYRQGVRSLFGLKVRDVDCDFRLIRRRVFDYIALEHNSGVICIELVKKLQNAGFTVYESGVHHYPRVYGRSQFFRIRPLIQTLRELAALWYDLVLPKRRIPLPSGSPDQPPIHVE